MSVDALGMEPPGCPLRVGSRPSPEGGKRTFERLARLASLAQPSAYAASLVISRGVRKYIAADDLDLGWTIFTGHGHLPWESASRLAPIVFRDGLKLGVDRQQRMASGAGCERQCCKSSSDPGFHTEKDVRSG